MISFDPKKLVVKHMQIKMVSGALGGMLTFLDEKRSKATGKEVFGKIKIPYHLTRHFAKKYRITKYIKPVLTAVTFYEDHVVCLERHPLGNLGREVTEGLFGDQTWQSDSSIVIDKMMKPLVQSQEWFIDGSYVYHVSDEDLIAAESLSSDKKFRQVKVKAIKLAALADKPDIEERVCLAFFPANGDMALTPPIWKTLTNIGQRQLTAKGDTRGEDEIERDDGVTYHTETDKTQFDKVDDMLCVNLGFALKAGRVLSEVFGYDSIEPLGLDDMMIQLKTVNLPNIANEVKQTFDTGLKFTIAIAWLIGMTKRVETLDSYIALRTLLKHLTTKGVYRKGAFDPNSIFKSGQDLTSVKKMSLAEAKAQIKTLSLDDFLRASRLAREAETAQTAPPADALGI
jgi:hypothetical protein